MSDLALFKNDNSFDPQAVMNRLEDLAQFGVHLHPVLPTNKCVCGAYAGRPWCEGWGYDELCRSCHKREGGESFYNRIYTNQTVFVSDPILTKGGKHNDGDGIWRERHCSTLYGLIVVDTQLCLIGTSLTHIEGLGWQPSWDTCHLYDRTTGEIAARFVFHISYSKLFTLGQTQAPL